MKRCLLAVTVALAAVALHQAAPAPRGLIASGRAPDLLLMYTGDVIGYVDPCG